LESGEKETHKDEAGPTGVYEDQDVFGLYFIVF